MADVLDTPENNNFYLQMNPDVVASGWWGTAYQHYQTFGKNEGRNWGIPSKDNIVSYLMEVLNTQKNNSYVPYYEINSTFSNPSNIDNIWNVYKERGLPEKNKGNNWESSMWTLFPFYYKVKLYEKYPRFDFKDAKNCEKTKNFKISLDEEKVYLDGLMVNASGDQFKQDLIRKQFIVLSEYMSEVNGAMATLNCTKLIDQKQQDEQLDIINKAADVNASQPTQSKVGTYVMYGIVILIAGVVVKKIFFKSN